MNRGGGGGGGGGAAVDVPSRPRAASARSSTSRRAAAASAGRRAATLFSRRRYSRRRRSSPPSAELGADADGPAVGLGLGGGDCAPRGEVVAERRRSCTAPTRRMRWRRPSGRRPGTAPRSTRARLPGADDGGRRDWHAAVERAAARARGCDSRGGARGAHAPRSDGLGGWLEDAGGEFAPPASLRQYCVALGVPPALRWRLWRRALGVSQMEPLDARAGSRASPRCCRRRCRAPPPSTPTSTPPSPPRSAAPPSSLAPLLRHEITLAITLLLKQLDLPAHPRLVNRTSRAAPPRRSPPPPHPPTAPASRRARATRPTSTSDLSAPVGAVQSGARRRPRPPGSVAPAAKWAGVAPAAPRREGPRRARPLLAPLPMARAARARSRCSRRSGATAALMRRRCALARRRRRRPRSCARARAPPPRPSRRPARARRAARAPPPRLPATDTAEPPRRTLRAVRRSALRGALARACPRARALLSSTPHGSAERARAARAAARARAYACAPLERGRRLGGLAARTPRVWVLDVRSDDEFARRSSAAHRPTAGRRRRFADAGVRGAAREQIAADCGADDGVLLAVAHVVGAR